MARSVSIFTVAPPPEVASMQRLPGVTQVKLEKKLFRPPTGFRFLVAGRPGAIELVPAAEIEGQVKPLMDCLRRGDRQAAAGHASIVDDIARGHAVEDLVHVLAATKTVLLCTVEEDFTEEQYDLPPAILALNRQLKGLAWSRKCLYNAEGKRIFGQSF